MSDIKVLKSKRELIGFWVNIPIVKEIKDDILSNILEQDVRRAIINILAQGVEEKDPKTGKMHRRYALSATEIRNLINESRAESEQINSSNLYFHLQKLEDWDIVFVVGQIPTGKRLTSYYARTAKGFISKDTVEQDSALSSAVESEDFPVLIKNISNEVDSEKMEDIITRLKTLDQTHYHEFKKWVSNHEQDALGLEIDFRHFYDLYCMIKNYDEQMIDDLKQLREWLDI